MHSSARRLAVSAALSAAMAVAAAVLTVTAHAAVDPAPIAPNQLFTGLVNATNDNPVVTTDCAGPVVPGQMGHPVSGQFVSVDPATTTSTVDVGFTGSLGDSVTVFLGGPTSSGPSSANLVGTLKDYAVRLAIPTTLEVPCDGPGKAAFVPEPTSPTAKTAILDVTFRNIGVTPGA
ncbi:MAG TPA: hypothetical protein VHX38_35930 [Pseudonocardiaceae bacterium]|nr:hypothetical protein [Pseudonocardiaceae bacterium]